MHACFAAHTLKFDMHTYMYMTYRTLRQSRRFEKFEKFKNSKIRKFGKKKKKSSKDLSTVVRRSPLAKPNTLATTNHQPTTNQFGHHPVRTVVYMYTCRGLYSSTYSIRTSA